MVIIVSEERQVFGLETELWEYLKGAKKPIVLYGMGNGADKIIEVLNRNNIKFEGVFASDGFVRNKLFHGHKISSYAELKEKFKDMIILLCFGSARPEVLENVKKLSSEQEIYAPEVPVIEGGLFTKSFYLENKQRFDFVYEHLADDLSKKTFINLIKYKISGKIEYLTECEVAEEEPYNSFLRLESNETFLDLGAYRGDTVEDFVKRVGGYESIIAVEPDKKSYKKLAQNTKMLKNITCVNAAVSSYCGVGEFAMKGGRSSGVSNGNSQIEFVTVDKLCENKKASFIKADVEGQEINVIKGAVNTIKQQKPKMQIACYHRTDDFITIPQEVFEIRNDYKLYLRHFVSLPAWDTNFYFV